jgi:uncharacterized protein (TIGR02757 family)
VPLIEATALRTLLERVYADCHRSELIDPDPLLVVRSYARTADRELAGLLCAVLALGRAGSIVDAARRCLAPFGEEPAAAVSELGPERTRERLGIDVYRFFKRRDLSALLSGASLLQLRFGSLDAAFAAGSSSASYLGSAVSAVSASSVAGPSVAGPSVRLLELCDTFVELILDSAREAAAVADISADGFSGSARRAHPRVRDTSALARNLLPAPRDGSACKRLMLFLRWMVRHDEVDVGAWTSLTPAELVIPLDTHVHRIALALGLTRRASADLRAALETTAALRVFDPIDPVRFDFSLARLGIRSDYSLKDYFNT